MATLSSIADKVRLELGDQSKSFEITFPADGTSTRYDTQQYPLDGTTLVVKVNGTVQTSNQVAVEERTGVLIFTNAPSTNAVIYVKGISYRYFGNTDMESFVATAVNQHLYHRTDAFQRQMTIANLPIIEEYPVALLATTLGLYALATDAAFDIDISAPDGVSIPRSERYRQLTDMLIQRQRQYEELCAALNIGLKRIEVFTLRRTSKITNKLIPLYIPQEIDDYSPANRVYTSLSTQGGEPIPTSSGRYDLVMTQGDYFSAILDFPFNLTGYTPKAQVRSFPEAAAVAAEFVCTITDAVNGKLKIELSTSKTKALPLKAFWDIQLTSGTTTNTYVSGTVFCTREITKDYNAESAPIYPPLLGGTAQGGFFSETSFDGSGRPL